MLLRITSILLITSLASFGIFGYLAMSFADHGMGHQCLFETFIGKDCAYLNGFLGAGIHHISVLRQLLQFVAASPLLFAVWALAILAGLSALGQVRLILIGSPSKQKRFSEKENIFRATEKFTRWIALLNKGGDPVLFSGA